MKAESTYGTLPKAPIIEAVINIQCNNEKASLDFLEKFADEIAIAFPTRQNSMEFSTTTRFTDEVKTEAQQQQVGFRLVSEDEKFIIVCKTNGFTFSRLNPYTDWDEFSKSARKYWEQYSAVVKPQLVNRLGIRYINQIDMSTADELKQYLKLNPSFPAILGNADNFFLRVVAPQNDIEATLILTEAQLESSSPEKKSFVLDIDLFSEESFPVDENIWGKFNIFRDRKNDIFFDAITDEYRIKLTEVYA